MAAPDQLRRQAELADWKAVLDAPAGRRTLARLLEHCHDNRTPYAGNTNDTMFRLGEQNVGLWLKAEAETARPGAVAESGEDMRRARESLTNGKGHRCTNDVLTEQESAHA